MIIERNTSYFKRLKCIKIFIIFVYIIIFAILYNSIARIFILILPISYLFNEIAVYRPSRFDKKHRPRIYNITSDRIVFEYCNKTVKTFNFDSIKAINVVITRIDTVILELIVDNNRDSERLLMYSNDFNDYPNVFNSFIILAKKAVISKYSCNSRMIPDIGRKPLIDNRDLLEILIGVQEKYNKKFLKVKYY